MACQMCYQGPVRRATRNARPGAVDHAAIRAAVEREGQSFTLFGGEAMLASIEDLEKLWAYGLERFGTNGVQTAGADIVDEHWPLFHKYKVSIGFSIEGPGELNDARRYGNLENTRAATERSNAALRRALSEGLSCSLITTLSTLNAGAPRLPRLLAWFRELDAAGLRSARLHTLELDGGARLIALPHDQALAAFRACNALERELSLKFDIYADMLKLLSADDDSVTCIWDSCDPWTTSAVHGIEADGSRSLCQRVHKDGRSWQPAPPGPYVRQLTLAATPQEDGGCQGCKFLTSCKGQCPGGSLGGDWRKRSADCALWYALLEDTERALQARGVTPVSLRPDRGIIEDRMKAAWARGVRPSIKGCVEDRYAGACAPGGSWHQDVDHGDSTAHGDHTDAAAVIPMLAGGEAVDDGLEAPSRRVEE